MNSDTDLDDGDRVAGVEPLLMSTESDPELLAALLGVFRKSDIS